MTKCDVFISHHSDSCKGLSADVSRVLDTYGIFGWYAERDIAATHNYTEKIIGAIRECKVFVLLLNKYANQSKHVLREVNIAMSNSKPILIVHLDDCIPNDAIAYVSSASQIVKVQGENEVIIAQRIGKEVCELLSEGTEEYVVSKEGYKTSWDGNDLSFYGDEGERNRINHQHHFVYQFAKDAYENILKDAKDASFLDVGCNTGEQAMMFVSKSEGIKHYIGIDREGEALDKGQELYPNAHFYLADCEADDFSQRLSSIEEELGIDGFDFINVSMLLLHTREPNELIDVLSSHLSENGQLIILDIDDGFNVAFPDPKELFKQAVNICFGTEYSGYRHCGRTIYKRLSDMGLDDICLHKIGLSTVGMTRSEKEKFFDIYFWFILDDLRKMNSEQPQNKLIKTDLEWMESNYKEMKMEFKKRDFFFNLGFVLFSARA